MFDKLNSAGHWVSRSRIEDLCIRRLWSIISSEQEPMQGCPTQFLTVVLEFNLHDSGPPGTGLDTPGLTSLNDPFCTAQMMYGAC